jgi:hypothetical protein
MTPKKRKPANNGPDKVEGAKLPLPKPAPREPGLITSFINLVDIAESIKQQSKPKP